MTTDDPAEVAAMSAVGLAAQLRVAVARGFSAWNECLVDNLDTEVEIRHVPAAPHLDGRRDATAAALYFREESSVFPRAFEADFRFQARVRARGAGVRAEIWHRGTLVLPSRPTVAVGFDLELGLSAGRITRVVGTGRPDTARADLIGWLEAVRLVGGFDPPPAQR
jgi:hypothetical protein